MVLGRELRLICDLLFGVPPDKEESTTDYAVDLAEQLHDIQHFAPQHLKLASDRMKACYDRLANTADLVARLQGIHHFASQHPKVDSDRLKACYDRLANSAGFQEGERVWFYRPT
jgi:hypothetical protein